MQALTRPHRMQTKQTKQQKESKPALKSLSLDYMCTQTQTNPMEGTIRQSLRSQAQYTHTVEDH